MWVVLCIVQRFVVWTELCWTVVLCCCGVVLLCYCAIVVVLLCWTPLLLCVVLRCLILSYVNLSYVASRCVKLSYVMLRCVVVFSALSCVLCLQFQNVSVYATKSQCYFFILFLKLLPRDVRMKGTPMCTVSCKNPLTNLANKSRLLSWELTWDVMKSTKKDMLSA